MKGTATTTNKCAAKLDCKQTGKDDTYASARNYASSDGIVDHGLICSSMKPYHDGGNP